jgi:hypothetical protein
MWIAWLHYVSRRAGRIYFWFVSSGRQFSATVNSLVHLGAVFCRATCISVWRLCQIRICTKCLRKFRHKFRDERVQNLVNKPRSTGLQYAGKGLNLQSHGTRSATEPYQTTTILARSRQQGSNLQLVVDLQLTFFLDEALMHNTQHNHHWSNPVKLESACTFPQLTEEERLWLAPAHITRYVYAGFGGWRTVSSGTWPARDKVYNSKPRTEELKENIRMWIANIPASKGKSEFSRQYKEFLRI